MSGFRALSIVSLATVLSGCDEGGCGGATCPFAEPSHHAMVAGVVLDSNDRPLAGIYTRVKHPREARSGVGTQTDSEGRFIATARADIPAGGADTASAWVQATQANLPPAAVVTDSVRVLLRFRPRTEPPVPVEVTIRLPVAP